MYDNALLDSLTGADSQLLRHRLTPIHFVQGDVIAEAGTPVRHVVFPRSGLVTLLIDLNDGDRIEVGMVGADGAIGATASNGGPSICTSCAQHSTRAWLMDSADAAEMARANATFCRLLCLQELWLQAQAQQIAACNAKHTIMHRLCSWLLRADDLAGGDGLLVTQEQLGQMLGVQRASVSLCASRLQERGLVQYRRGRLRILDAGRLGEHACECHGVLRQKRDLLINGDAPRQRMRSEFASLH